MVSAVLVFCACVASRFAELPPMAEADVNYRTVGDLDDAAWVWTTDADRPGFRRFRADFESDGSRLDLAVSADERYVLLLDGREISRGPARGMPSHWFASRIASELDAGRHRLEAVVWTLGEDAPRAQLTCGGGFFLKAGGRYDAVLTTGKGAWRVAPVAGTIPDGRTYARAFGGGTQFRVSGASFVDELPDDSSFVPVTTARVCVAGNWGGGVQVGRWALFDSRIPEMMMRRIRPGELPRAGFAVGAHEQRTILSDLGDYYCAYPELVVSGGKGAKVRWGWTEALVDADGRKGNRGSREGLFTQAVFDTFLPDGRAEARFTVPWWRCGRWCRIEIETSDEPMEVRDVALVETRYPLECEADFTAEGDSLLPGIAEMCVRGVQMCAHEIMFDCPFYEQQMYPGDIRMSFAAMRSMSADARLARQCLALFDEARLPGGLVPMNWPCRLDQRSSTWTLSWIAAIGDLAMYDGPDALPWLGNRAAGIAHTLLSYARLEDADGLLIDPPGWNFLDWTAPWKGDNYTPPNGIAGRGPDACLNLLYLQAMESAVTVFGAIGEPLLAERWRTRGERLAAAIRRTFWDEGRGMVADTPEKTSFSEHAQALAVTTECLPRPLRDRAFEGLVTSKDLALASYMLHAVFEAYFRYGRGDLFLKRLDQWRGYLKLDLRCPLESPEFPRSDCHAFASTPYHHFHAGLAGVRPAAPFFAKVAVRPSPGGLGSIRAHTPHPRGFVDTDLRFDGTGGVDGSVALPDGVDGTFEWNGRTVQLPAGRRTRVSVR